MGGKWVPSKAQGLCRGEKEGHLSARNSWCVVRGSCSENRDIRQKKGVCARQGGLCTVKGTCTGDKALHRGDRQDA